MSGCVPGWMHDSVTLFPCGQNMDYMFRFWVMGSKVNVKFDYL